MNGKAELMEVRFDEDRNSLIVQANASLHFQVEDRLSSTPPNLVLRLFNATPARGFTMPKEAVGPIELLAKEAIPASDGTPAETRIKLVLKAKYRFLSTLSPDTKQAAIRFDRAPIIDTEGLARGLAVRHLEYANARDVANTLSMMIPQGSGRTG